MIFYQLELKPSPIVTLIHGLGEDHSIFNRQINYLQERGYSTLAIDLEGHGRSKTQAKISIPRHAHNLYEVLTKENIPETSIAGFSLGAAVSLEFACQFPEMASKLCLINPALYDDNSLRPKTKIAGYLIEKISFISELDNSTRRNPSNLSQTKSSNAYFSFLNGLRATSFGGLYQNIQALMDYSLPLHFSQMNSPTLIVQSKNDELLNEDISCKLNKMIPNSRRIEMSGNHVLMLDKTPEINNLLLNWMRMKPEK